MATCSECNGTRVVKVMVREEEQVRTCLACFRPASREIARSEQAQYEPIGAPEAGTPTEYRLGMKREGWRLAW